MKINNYIERHKGDYLCLAIIAIAGIIDSVVCLLTLCRYQTTFRVAVLFYADDDKAIPMIKAAIKGCK